MRDKFVKTIFILIVIIMAASILCLTNDGVKENLNVEPLGVVAFFVGMIIICIFGVIIYFKK